MRSRNRLYSVLAPRGIHIEEIGSSHLPEYWQRTPAPEQLQELGTAWIHRRSSLLLRVPSAVIPEEHNYLVNPSHRDFPRLRVGKPKLFIFDSRLFKGQKR